MLLHMKSNCYHIDIDMVSCLSILVLCCVDRINNEILDKIMSNFNSTNVSTRILWFILLIVCIVLPTRAFNLSLIQLPTHQLRQLQHRLSPLQQPRSAQQQLHIKYESWLSPMIRQHQPSSQYLQSSSEEPVPSGRQQQQQQQQLQQQSQPKIIPIFVQSQLQQHYNDTAYNNILTCSNGQLFIIQFNRTQTNQTLLLKYTGLLLTQAGVTINSKIDRPKAGLLSIQYDPQSQHSAYGGQSISASGSILIYSGCLGAGTGKDTYFNKVDVILQGNSTLDSHSMEYVKNNPWRQFRFSFLLSCDHGGRNKKFEYGYLVIALINAVITIGVALHSRIWSIRYNQRPLSIELTWNRFLIGMLAMVAAGSAIFVYAKDQFINANKLLKYSGLSLAYFFAFICSDEILFLVRKFKQEIYRMIRICDILSAVVATAMFVTGLFVDNWVYSNVLAIGICVGAIKLFRFSTMKQAYMSMAISVIIVSIVAIVLHFVLTRSYNDYGSELSSPLFVLIPDLIDELYKKCSWLPVIDVIVPGVFLSFLRTYDENYNTGWGGVYTLIGNLSFILSTLLWVLLQAVYPYSIPFCLITYTILALSVFLISYKRNQFKTLWSGRFNGANNEISLHLLESDDEHNQKNIIGQSDRKSFSKLVTADMIDGVKYDADKDEESGEHDDQFKVNRASQ